MIKVRKVVNQKLELEAIELRELANIREKAHRLGMVKTEQVEYLSGSREEELAVR